MSRKHKLWIGVLVAGAALAAIIYYLMNAHIAVLTPAGVIGQKERRLMIIATLLCLAVVIPVFILTAYIAWTYRESNQKAKYSPSWDHSFKLEFAWWAIPLAIITILAVITWKSSHELDPFRSLSSSQPPLAVQVVALQWKWLFIYPDQNIASVNFVQLPLNRPIDFQITSDAPMNSFWIPKLGGQIYAMSGMSTQLHLMASQTGEFAGSSANISGRGFAGMRFMAKVSNQADFKAWVNNVKRMPDSLSLAQYSQLSQPSEDNPVALYGSSTPGLFHDVMMKYMAPGSNLASQGYGLAGVKQHVH
jgi:cytochrome o ubiquinol oxidase subunit 2